MKKIGNYAVSALSVTAIVFSVATFCEIKAEPKEPEVQEMSVATAVQPVDLTYAAEKALPTVVHIKYVQNSKIQTVEVQSDPFDDFFSDPFGGFFGRWCYSTGSFHRCQTRNDNSARCFSYTQPGREPPAG